MTAAVPHGAGIIHYGGNYLLNFLTIGLPVKPMDFVRQPASVR
jgi:hypothetical protein